MVLPSLRPIESETQEEKNGSRLRPIRRPPLNRAIPTIPESKSNESIMTQNSERKDSKVSTPIEDRCVIIENKMADSLTSTTISTISKIPPPKTMLPKFGGSSRTPSTSVNPVRNPKSKAETPRSPLMSVAHSVRSKLSKLGRLGRSEEGSSIKESRSMISMRGAPRRGESESSYKMAKSHSMEASSSKDSKLRMPSKIGVLRKSASREIEEEKRGKDEENGGEDSSMETEENIRKSVAIVRATYRQAHTSIVLRDPTSTTSTILAVEETIILPTNEINKPTDLGVQEINEMMKDSGVVAGSPDDKAEAADLFGKDDEGDFELAQDLLDEPDDEIPMDISFTPMTPMSETSTLYLQPFGHPEAELLRLKRVHEEPEVIAKKEIFRIKAEVEPQPVILSETSTIILSPDGEGGEMRLKKIHSEKYQNGEEYRAEKPDMNDITNVVKDIANFCVAPQRTHSITSSQPSILDLVPENQRESTPIHLEKIPSKKKQEEITTMFKQVAAFCMAQPRTTSIVPSETSTLYLLPLGDEGNEPIRLRKLHADGTETVAETPDEVQKMLKDVAAFCMKQPRTNSICLSDASSVHLLPLGGSGEEGLRLKKIHVEKSLPQTPIKERIEEKDGDVLRDIAVFCWAQPRRDSIAGSDVSSLCLMPLGGEEKVFLKKINFMKEQTGESSPIRELASPDDVGHIFNEISACCINAPRTASFPVSDASSLYLAPIGESTSQIVHLKKAVKGEEKEEQEIVVQQESVEMQKLQKTHGFCMKKPEVDSIVLSETSTLCLQPIGEEGMVLDGEPMLRLKKVHNTNVMRNPEMRPFQINDSVLTIDTTPMSEASTLLWANVGRENEEANMLRLKRVRDALEKHLEGKQTIKTKKDPIVLSETSTLMLMPIDDEQAEPLRLKKIRDNQQVNQSPKKVEEKIEEIISPCSSNEAVSTESNLENIEPMSVKKELPPVFHVPAPPPRETLLVEHKGTSPLKRPKQQPPPKPDEKTKVAMVKEQKGATKLRQSLSMREEKEKEKEPKAKTPRTPLSARSLKNFLLKKDKVKITKPLPTSATMPLSPRHNLSLRFRQDAPLAESESTVIENSPHVEFPPMRFGQWNASPRGRRRASDRPPSQLALFDKNGNNMRGPRDISNTSVRSTQEPGLIDDEIRDQPMLMGDSFSTSNSIDGLAAVTMLRSSYEPDATTIMSIDRSTIDDHNNEHRRSYHDSPAPPSHSSANHGHLSTIYSPPSNQKQIEASLAEVEAMRAQLVALQSALAQMTPESPPQNKQGQIGCCELARENDVLRRQLSEKDRIISQLREQLAITKITH
ncbi:unnamed protein product, partial [Mesorhabditis belari]|uniref:Uncharacterized protein n=1 Tax=Mesorhabditis belari TaxID=2138241 RepID=A0AAF3FCK4_9BILA